MDTRFTLSQIVDAVLGGSVKTAQAETCEKCGKPSMQGSKLCRDCADKDTRKEDTESNATTPAEAEKTSSERVIKLASAVDFILAHPESIHPALGRVKLASPPEVASAGPGKGPNPMSTNLMEAVGGTQSTVSGQAKTKIPMVTPTVKSTPDSKAPDNAMETNLKEDPTPYPADGPLVQKQASFRDRAIKAIMKRAADVENKSSISSPTSTALPEDQPDLLKRPAEVTSQEKYIASNAAATDVTKRETKAVPKKRMAEVLSEPAQTSATDKILDANLGSKVVNEAGAKIASAKKLLTKVAAEGCSCEGKGTCGHCKVAARLKQRKNGQ